MEPQRTTPIDMRRYGYAIVPPFGFGGGGADGGVIPATGDAGVEFGVAGAASGDLVPTRGRDFGVSLL